ncbi:hypothetical protein HQN84_20855 [Pedobacter steynii]|nr:hypothetical protein [Pedobacter steynii]
MVYFPEVHAQNLLDLQGWTIGTGSSGIFTANGLDSENSREWGEGPRGERTILWKASPDGNVDGDGGWNSLFFAISNANMYRFAVWIKKTNSLDGTTYFGCQNVRYLDGSNNDNAYFLERKLPEINKWYLLIGYIHASNDESLVNYGGVYDGTTGAKVGTATDFKFKPGAVNTNHRTYLFYDPNVNDRQFFYAPRVDLVNGNEPTIASLLGLQGVSGDMAYFPGKVGIKTSVPGDYELAVKGKIRAQEIKVEGGIWPDYVFAKSYELPVLSETEKFIRENGHLPGVPAAAEVKANGINIGDMNTKLLQKIEELTLHLIRQQKEIDQLKKRK